ncbi:MAG: Hsp20/alpha crystallin family protein [Planctomycetes bacterium]|nr:Hsp20/alpha crystallin family protein [Planctomycetota bacterium]
MLRLQRVFPAPFDILRPEFGRLLDLATRPFLDEPALRPQQPLLNIWEEGDSLVAEAELPGVKLDDIEVTVLGNELTIRGSRGSCACEKGAVHRSERNTGAFSRTVALPVEINAERVEAALKDGVLTVVMPKAETAKTRKITVRAV